MGTVMRHRALVTWTCILTLAVAFIMLRIEWLNRRAGGCLPITEFRNDDPAAGPVTWRTSPFTNEARWREWLGPKDAQDTPVDRPLTPSEQAQMQSDIRKASANNELLTFAQTAGLAQYLLAPILIIASLAVIRIVGLRYGIVPLLVGTIAAALMIYRAYYMSLA